MSTIKNKKSLISVASTVAEMQSLANLTNSTVSIVYLSKHRCYEATVDSRKMHGKEVYQADDFISAVSLCVDYMGDILTLPY